MVIYRPHRGSLSEAIAEAREFGSFDEMKQYIVNDEKQCFGKPGFEISDIVICEVKRCDDRIGWKDERYVCIKRYFGEDYMEKYGTPQCIGMCATDYPGLNESREMCWNYLRGNVV